MVRLPTSGKVSEVIRGKQLGRELRERTHEWDIEWFKP
jgi:hypothetical protein